LDKLTVFYINYTKTATNKHPARVNSGIQIFCKTIWHVVKDGTKLNIVFAGLEVNIKESEQ
jgi:hypothetical protein